MITVVVWKPSIIASGSNVAYTPKGSRVYNLHGQGEFNLVITSSGGYWSFSMTISDNQGDIEDWIANGLQYNIVVVDESGTIIWEGFVNSLSANISGLSVQKGPLLDIGNRVSATFAREDVVGNEIVTTSNLTTVIIPPASPSTTLELKVRNSQLTYGIFEKIVNAGTVWSNSVAEDIRDTWANERCIPETTKSFALGGNSPPSVTINCLGWIHFLGNYIYNANDTGVGLNTSTTVGDKIVYVIDGDPLSVAANGDPNGLFDAAGGDISANAMLCSRWEDQNTVAWGIIKDLVSAGDISGNRYIFGLYANRKIVYKQIPSDLEYTQRLSDPAQDIVTVAGARVFPWNVLPGKWMMFTDFLVGKTQPSDLREDQRALFIEKVAYSTPWGLQLDGAKVGTIDQKLKQRGLGLATA